MKRTYQIVLGILAAMLMLATMVGCDDNGINLLCDKGGNVIHRLDKAEGRIVYDQEINAWIITYGVPGSIDCVWWGVVCNSDFPDFEPEAIQRVRFSGNFKDDRDEFDAFVRFGGQQFFYLEVTFVESIL